MKRLLTGILLMLLYVAAEAQEQTPDLLLHAAQCLSAKHFLAPSKATVLSFGYMLDLKSYPGEKVEYVVRYTRSDRSQGEAFTLSASEPDKQQTFNITNNASFVRTKSGVKFTGDPLGGIWTQQHLVSAIKQIERRPRFEISVRNLHPSSNIRCKAYTDN